MSFVIAVPQHVAAAATDLTSIGSTISSANSAASGPTSKVLAAAADEVSAQIAALFGTAILTVLPATQFAGMMTPVSSLAKEAQIMGHAFPMTYFVPISVGTFTKGLGFRDLWTDVVALAIFVPVLALLSVLMLRKQER